MAEMLAQCSRVIQNMPTQFSALVVDDQEDNSQSFKRALTQLGCRVITAEDQESGLEKLSNGTRFDIVFLSLCLKGSGARSIAREIRRKEPTAKIVLMTSWQGQLDTTVLATDGVNAVVHKPLKFNELRDSLITQLG